MPALQACSGAPDHLGLFICSPEVLVREKTAAQIVVVSRQSQTVVHII